MQSNGTWHCVCLPFIWFAIFRYGKESARLAKWFGSRHSFRMQCYLFYWFVASHCLARPKASNIICIRISMQFTRLKFGLTQPRKFSSRLVQALVFYLHTRHTINTTIMSTSNNFAVLDSFSFIENHLLCPVSEMLYLPVLSTRPQVSVQVSSFFLCSVTWHIRLVKVLKTLPLRALALCSLFTLLPLRQCLAECSGRWFSSWCCWHLALIVR